MHDMTLKHLMIIIFVEYHRRRHGHTIPNSHQGPPTLHHTLYVLHLEILAGSLQQFSIEKIRFRVLITPSLLGDRLTS